MSETISRDAAINELERAKVRVNHSVERAIGRGIIEILDDVEKSIIGLQSAEPKIIRCKDCKYWIPYDWMFSEVWRSKNMADYSEDEIGCKFCDMTMKANDFCSRGERRTE